MFILDTLLLSQVDNRSLDSLGKLSSSEGDYLKRSIPQEYK
jgi:hypothetical protein